MYFYLERLPYWFARTLDSLLEPGGLIPLCLATLVAYIFVVVRR